MSPTAYIFIKYLCLVVPYINPVNQVPGVQTGPAQGIKSFHRLIIGFFLKSSSLKPWGP